MILLYYYYDVYTMTTIINNKVLNLQFLWRRFNRALKQGRSARSSIDVLTECFLVFGRVVQKFRSNTKKHSVKYCRKYPFRSKGTSTPGDKGCQYKFVFACILQNTFNVYTWERYMGVGSVSQSSNPKELYDFRARFEISLLLPWLTTN